MLQLIFFLYIYNFYLLHTVNVFKVPFRNIQNFEFFYVCEGLMTEKIALLCIGYYLIDGLQTDKYTNKILIKRCASLFNYVYVIFIYSHSNILTYINVNLLFYFFQGHGILF